MHEASRAVIVVSDPASGLLAACQHRFQQQVAESFRHGTGQLDRLGGVGQRKLGRQPTPSYQLRHDGPTVNHASPAPVSAHPYISQSMYSPYHNHQILSVTFVTKTQLAVRPMQPSIAWKWIGWASKRWNAGQWVLTHPGALLDTADTSVPAGRLLSVTGVTGSQLSS